MKFFERKTVLTFLFAVMGLTGVYAQSEIPVFWEIRNYYVDADNPQVEVFLTIDDGKQLKEFVFFAPGEAAEIPEAGQYKLSAWYYYTSYEYRFSMEKNSIRILKQKVEYSKEVNDFIPVPPGWEEIKHIPIAPGKAFIPGSGVTIQAKNLFHRLLSFQENRMNGDDVWALQRFLSEQGYTEVGEVDGWFGPNTEKAVKRFQNSRQLTEDGAVDQVLWDMLSGLDKENVNFFRGDYGD